METNGGQLKHLTDEQFTELLRGDAPASTAEHVKGCGQCSQEAERVAGAIGSFAQQSRLWAERRAAARPMQAYGRQQTSSWQRVAQGAVAWVAAAVVLAAGVGLVRKTGQPVAVREPVAALHAAPAVSPATLKADNQLLSAIDGELSEDDAPSAGSYGLTASRHPGRTRSTKGISN